MFISAVVRGLEEGLISCLYEDSLSSCYRDLSLVPLCSCLPRFIERRMIYKIKYWNNNN